MTQEPVTASYRFHIGPTLHRKLNLLSTTLYDEIISSVDPVVQHYFVTQGTVNVDELDISELVFNLVEMFVQLVSIDATAAKGIEETQRLITALMPQLMSNVAFDRSRYKFLIVFDLIETQHYIKPTVGAVWVASKHLHELHINNIH